MNNKNDKKHKLTPEESVFLRDLLVENKNNIKNAVRSVLKTNFKYLVEDCISEVTLLVLQNPKTLMEHKNPNGWIVVASKRVASNLIRKEYTRLKNTGKEITYDIPTGKDTVHEDALYNIWMENKSIETLLKELTPREKEVYDLVYRKRLTSKKAGELLGISASTVRNIDSNIKEKIKYAVKKKL